MQVALTLKSRNEKTGPIPVSTSSADTCPKACPLRDKVCYAKYGPLGMLWAALNRGKPNTEVPHGRGMLRALSWETFCRAIEGLPAGALWRHNQAGDLPGVGDKVGVRALERLVKANAGRRGFTYTHKPIVGRHGPSNARAIGEANARGFTINLSADSLEEADELAESGVAPVVVVLDQGVNGGTLSTPAGRRVVVCPATYQADVTCQSCGLCAVGHRKSIVGFPAHGAGKGKFAG